MEKLLELLNEYETYIRKKENGISLKGIWTGDSDYGIIRYGGFFGAFSELYAISKNYGFIKWLVDNDKTSYRDNCKYTTDCDYENTLLMQLAIQTKPIEFLISILK